MTPRETVNNAYAKFAGDKQRALRYVMVFLEWSMLPPLMSCDLEVTNESAHCWKTISSYITRRFVYSV